ncbi:hypothetical protein F4825DRAFT_428018 [Nemania diffusa]|nr:hypothetical protein F4825DRAFT_428018 [Nemania diffusa]
MSHKITPKNLTYDNSLPPFLARLHGQQAARSGPDPILAAQRRPGQKRSASEGAEDAPVIVDEAGNVVTLEDGLLEGGDASSDQKDNKEPGEGNSRQKEGSNNNGGEGDLAPGKEKEKVAAIGASRKRKVGRVIGDDGEDGTKSGKNSDDAARIAKASADVRRLLHQDEDDTPRCRNNSNAISSDGHKSTKAVDDKKTIKSAKRKPAKKIKLSFGDNDDGE